MLSAHSERPVLRGGGLMIVGFLSRHMTAAISAMFFFTVLVLLVSSLPSNHHHYYYSGQDFTTLRRDGKEESALLSHQVKWSSLRSHPSPLYPDSQWIIKNYQQRSQEHLLQNTNRNRPQYPSRGSLTYHSGALRNRFVSDDVWRPNDAYDAAHQNSQQHGNREVLRPKQRPLEDYPSRSEYLKQMIPADYAHGSEDLFLMIKTGATVLWNRLPVHVATTLTRVPHFALYADQASSVGGHEVVDALANLTAATAGSEQLALYRTLRAMRERHAAADAGHTPLAGGWHLDKFKNLPMLAHAWRTAPPQVQWFVFMDGDSYMLLDNLMDYLSTLDPARPYYIGNHQVLGEASFAHGGSGVVLSRAAMNASVGAHPHAVHGLERETLDVCCGDFMVAELLRRYGGVGLLTAEDDWNDEWREDDTRTRWWRRNLERREREEREQGSRAFQGRRVGAKFTKFPQWDLAVARADWCNKVVSFHHLSAMDVEVLWEYERMLSPERRRHITYSDIYRDFVAPYIESFMPGWNSMARENEFSRKKYLEDLEKAQKAQEEEDKLEKERLEVGADNEALEDSISEPNAEPRELSDIAEIFKKRYSNGHTVLEFEDVNSGMHPWDSAELCQQKCLEDAYCLSWRFLPEEQYCGTDTAVRLGRPAFDFLEYDEEEAGRQLGGAVSGYVVDRVRHIRRAKDCDAEYRLTRAEDLAALDRALAVADAADEARSERRDEAGRRGYRSAMDMVQRRLITHEGADYYEGWYLRARLADQLQEERARKMRRDKLEAQGEVAEESAMSEAETQLIDDRARHLKNLKWLREREMGNAI